MTARAIDTLASLAALLVALALAGCAGLRGLDAPPQVSLVNLKPVQIQLFEQRYLATIRILNPNPVALPIAGLEYAISINGSEFANGVSNQRVTVPAYGEKTLDLGVSSTLVKLFDQIRRFGSSGGTIEYAISGTLGVQGLARSIPFAQDGEIDLRLDTPPPKREARPGHGMLQAAGTRIDLSRVRRCDAARSHPAASHRGHARCTDSSL